MCIYMNVLQDVLVHLQGLGTPAGPASRPCSIGNENEPILKERSLTFIMDLGNSW